VGLSDGDSLHLLLVGSGVVWSCTLFRSPRTCLRGGLGPRRVGDPGSFVAQGGLLLPQALFMTRIGYGVGRAPYPTPSLLGRGRTTCLKEITPRRFPVCGWWEGPRHACLQKASGESAVGQKLARSFGVASKGRDLSRTVATRARRWIV
jgi:hypothetical protein